MTKNRKTNRLKTNDTGQLQCIQQKGEIKGRNKELVMAVTEELILIIPKNELANA